MRENESMTLKKRKAIAALLSEPTKAEAAQHAGIAEATLYRWLADDDFRAALNKAEAHAINEAVRHLVRLQTKAAQTIEAILDDPESPPGIRLRAALGVFSAMIKLREFAILETRMAELEKRVDEQLERTNESLGASHSRPLR